MPTIPNNNVDIRVAELGSLSSGAKMAMKIFVKRVFTIFATNASFLRVITKGLVPFTRLVKVRRGKGRFPEKR